MVEIEVKEGKYYKDEYSAFIKFKYDSRYVNLMRSLPIRHWHPDILMWEVPYTDLDLVINKLDKEEYKLNTDKVVFEEKYEVSIPSDYKFKTKPFQHQIDGVEYGLNHNKFLLGDEQGCIDGDMYVHFQIDNNFHSSKLSDFYTFYKQCIAKDYIKVQCYINGIIGYNGINDVIYSGEKSVYRLTLKNGSSVNATSDHEIRTTLGYIPMEKLTTSHFVYTTEEAVKVQSVEYIGVKKTYDIKMQAPYHNFVANNIIVHNCGKALSLNTKVYTLNGYKLMRDIEVGDYVFNKQGKPVEVLAVYDNQQVNMCEITFSDGNKVECCEDHLWEINTRVGKKVVDTKWFFFNTDIENAVVKDSSGYLYSIDRCDPVEFTPQIIPMNPYYYGRNIDIKSETAYIDKVYKYNCTDVRYAVVKGIVERCSAIHTTPTNILSLNCCVWSEQLAEDLQYMFESLGCIVDIAKGEQANCTMFELTVQTNNYSKFVEGNSTVLSNADIVRTITNIKRVGKQDAKCITVDDSSGLYLIDHFIVTHNTKQMIDLACIKKQMYGYKHCLVIACVNGLKYNWQEEIKIHSDETGYILGTTIKKNGSISIGSNEKRLADLRNIDNIDSYFLITNIETLRYNIREKVPIKAKTNGATRYKTVTTFPIVDELQRLVKAKEIGMIVVDEIHRCLCANTPILTDKGLIPIVKIVNERCYMVATRTETGDIEYVEPVNYFTNPVPNRAIKLIIDTKQGVKIITCTVNHKFLTSNRGYVEAQDLTEDDDIIEV